MKPSENAMAGWQLVLFSLQWLSELRDGHNHNHIAGTKMIADPEKCLQELISEKLLVLLRDRPSPELIRLCSSCRTNYWNQSGTCSFQ